MDRKNELIIYMSNLYALMLNLDKTGQEYADKKGLFAEEYRIACDEYTDIIEKEHHERAGNKAARDRAEAERGTPISGGLLEMDRGGHEDHPSAIDGVAKSSPRS